jgi:hypothetical protein
MTFIVAPVPFAVVIGCWTAGYLADWITARLGSRRMIAGHFGLASGVKAQERFVPLWALMQSGGGKHCVSGAPTVDLGRISHRVGSPRRVSPQVDADPSSLDRGARHRQDSGDKQAKAELRCLQIDEGAVACGPPTGCEVLSKAAHCALLGVPSNPGPH